MTVLADGPGLRGTLATACRVLAARGLVSGALGHVSARVSDDELVVRCRGPEERGLRWTEARDVHRLTLDGEPVDVPAGWAPPKELPLHAELLRARPELAAVVHAHPRSALLCGLAGIEPRPVFGAYDIPALRLALKGVPVYRRSVLVTTAGIAREVVAAMGDADVCLLLGHGVVVGGSSVEQATVRTVTLDVLLDVSVRLAGLGARPPDVPPADLAELPNLGPAFDDAQAWRVLVAEAGL